MDVQGIGGLTVGGKQLIIAPEGTTSSAPNVLPTGSFSGGGGQQQQQQQYSDPYAAWGGTDKYNSLVSGFNTQKGNIYSTSRDSAASLIPGLNTSINDTIHSLQAGQASIDRKAVNNESSLKQGTAGVLGMVGRGIKSAGVMLAGKNASNSSAKAALANAYGELGQRQQSSIGNQYAQNAGDIALDQGNQDWAVQQAPTKFHNSLMASVNDIVSQAGNRLGELDAAMANASLPDRIAIEQEKQTIRNETLGILQAYDQRMAAEAGGIHASSRETNMTNAQNQIQAGQADPNMFQYTDQAPMGMAAGPTAGLPIYTAGRRPRQAQVTHMALNLKQIGQRLVAQVNPFDNGRTWQNQTPTNNRSVIGQIAHNGVTNTVGNMAVKPIVATGQNAVDAGRGVVAIATHNPAAQAAATHRFSQNFAQSIPGFVVGQGKAVGDIATSLPTVLGNELTNWKPVHVGKIPVGMLPQGSAPTTEESAAMRKGLTGLNNTTVGQMVSPYESAMNSFIPGAKEASAQAGYDVNGSFAKKNIVAPVMGAVGTYGLLKGGAGVAKGGVKASVAIKDTAKNTVSNVKMNRALAAEATQSIRPQSADIADMSNNQFIPHKVTQIPVTKEGGGNVPIPTRVITKIPVKQLPDSATLDARFQEGATKLSQARDAEMADAMNKPDITRNSLVKDIETKYSNLYDDLVKSHQDGSLGRGIPVKEAPVEKVPTVSGKPKVALNPDTTIKPTITAKEAEKLAKIEVKANPTHNELIQEALLREKAGKAPFEKAPEAPAPPEVAPRPVGEVPLDLPNPSSTLSAPKPPSLVDKVFLSTTGLMSKMGAGGKAIAERIQTARNESEAFQGKLWQQMPAVLELTKKGDVETFARVLEARSKGEAVTAEPRILQAVDEWNNTMPQIVERARAAGIDMGDLGPNYFPRVYKDLFSKDHAFNKMAEDMVKEGKATSLEDAITKLNFVKEQYVKSYGNLDKSRTLDMPNYEKTHETIANYIAKSADRIAKAEQLGAKGEILDQAKAHMMREGHNVAPESTFDKNLNIALGNVHRDTTGYKFSSGVRIANSYRSLNTAGISNASQFPVNTGTVAGLGRMAKGGFKALTSPEARAEAMKTGADMDHMLSNVAAQQTGVTGAITRNIASPFFYKIEKFNRQATAIVGKDYGNHLAAKGDVAELRRFGVEGEIGDTLTEKQSIQMSQGLVKRAQFKVDPMDLPAWADSPAGKLAAQFRTFGYKQTSFMWNEVLHEALKGNITPLVRFTATSVPIGSAQIAAKGAIKATPMYSQNDNGKINLAAQVGNAMAAVGGGGLVASEGQNLYNGIKYQDPLGAVASTIGGPTVGFGLEVMKNTTKGMKGNWDPLKKTLTRSVPGIGPEIANRVFPSQQPKPVNEKNVTSASLADINAQDAKDKAKYEKTSSNNGDYNLTKTSTGKYMFHIDGKTTTVDDKQKAWKEINKDQFAKSGEDSQTKGDWYFYRNENGDVATPVRKYKHEFDVADKQNNYDMDVAKNEGDVGGWMKAADFQLRALDTLKNKYNKDSQKDKVIATEKKIYDLQKSIAKYQSYGGFKKGSGSGYGSVSKSAANASVNPYKYSVSLKAGGSAPAVTKAKVVGKGLKYGSKVSTATPKMTVKKAKTQ